MEIHDSLYDSERIRLTSIDHEKDAEVEAGWTHNPFFLRMAYLQPAQPFSAEKVKKKYEAIEKDIEENKNAFYFAVRTQSDEDQPEGRLIGFARLYWIEWTHGNANLQLGLGQPEDWGQGYGTEILRLMLRYAFAELNLFRLTAVIPEYNQASLHLFQKAGFVEEACRREAVHRDGRYWDLLNLGLLAQEWVEQQPQTSAPVKPEE